MDAAARERVRNYLAALPMDADDAASTLSGGAESPAAAATAATTARHPLAFVAAKSATQLADRAKQQMREADETKRCKLELIQAGDDDEWLSKLDSWRSKRRVVSSSSLRRADRPTVAVESRKAALEGRRKSSLQPADRPRWSDDNSIASAGGDSATEVRRPASLGQRLSSPKPSMENPSPVSVVGETKNKFAAFDLEDSGHFESDSESQSMHSRQSSNGATSENCLPEGKDTVDEIPKLPASPSNQTSQSSASESDAPKAPKSVTFGAIRSRVVLPEKVAWKYQEKLKKTFEQLSITIQQRMGADRNFGFSVSGGKNKNEPVTVNGVILGSAADKAALLVGDEIVSINGESVATKYHAAVNRMIAEAVRLGEIELQVRRGHYDGGKAAPRVTVDRDDTAQPPTLSSFDEKRCVFDQPAEQDSYYRFRQSRPASDRTWLRPAMRNPAAGAPPPPPVNGRAATVDYDADYRVTSCHSRRVPGRLADFVPECEREDSASSLSDQTSPRPPSSQHSSVADRQLLDSRVNGVVCVCAPLDILQASDDDGDVESSADSLEMDGKLHRLSLTRGLRNGIVRARARFLGLSLSQPTPESDYVDTNVYRRWDLQRDAYDRAQHLLAALPEDLYFDRPRRFTYVDEQRPHLPYSRVTVRRTRSVVVVPVRAGTADHRARFQVIQQQRQARPPSPPPLQRFSAPLVRIDKTTSNEQSDRMTSPRPPSEAAAAVKPDAQPPNVYSPEPQPEESNRLNDAKSQPLYMNLVANHSLIGERPSVEESDRHWLVSESVTAPRLSDQLRAEAAAADSRKQASPAPPPPAATEDSGEPVVSVSGRQLCCHCSNELGRGAAMVIESLKLFYHLRCFRCYVCGCALGDGQHGADVRVRNARLHCQLCYSNDESGLKFSEV